MSCVFETLMLICFGAAWPASILKSYTSKSTNGKSLAFLLIVEVGYISGMLFKITGEFNGVFYLYLLNFIMVLIDICLYFRNISLAKKFELAKI